MDSNTKLILELAMVFLMIISGLIIKVHKPLGVVLGAISITGFIYVLKLPVT
jgi:hypothetical protein